MKKIIHLLKKYRNGFASKIALVASGTLIAQVLNIIFTPIITRLFPADQYGIMSVYTATISIIVIMASFSFQKTIPIAANDNEAKEIVEICFSILGMIVVCILIGCLFIKQELFEILGISPLYSVRFAIPIGVVFVGSYEILLQWTYRKREYKLVPKTRISQAVSGNSIKLISGLLHFGSVGLIIGVVASQAAGLITLAKKILYDLRVRDCNSSVGKKILLKRYKNFPLFSMPADFLDNFANQIPVIVLSGAFSSAVSGMYGLANTIISIPISLVVTSMSRVMYAEAANLGKENAVEIKRICIKMVKFSAVFITVPCIVLLLWGPQLFSVVFGTGWFEAGVFAKTMVGRTIAYCIVLPIGRMLDVFERQYFDMIINIGRILLLMISVFMINTLPINEYVASFIINSINMISNIVLFILIFYSINIQIKINKGDIK